MKQAIRKVVQCETNFMKTVGQSGEDVGQFAAARGFVGSYKLVVAAADLLVKPNVGRPPQAAPLGVFVKDSTDKKRIIADVSAEQKCLFRCGAGKGNQHVGDIFMRAILDLIRRMQLVRARKCFQERADIITQFTVADSGLLQNITCQNVKIELGGNAKMPGVGKDCFY